MTNNDNKQQTTPFSKLEEAADDFLFLPDLTVAIFNNNPYAIIVVNSEGKIVLANIQAEFLSGYHRSELKGQMVEILIPDDLKDKHIKYREIYMSEPVTRPMGLGLGLKLKRKSGAVIPVDISFSPISTQKGIFVITTLRRQKQKQEIQEDNDDS